MSKPHVFVSFDIEHDEELYERLLAQSRTPVSGFEVSGGSERSTATDGGSEIAQEERTPYFLLWGRRDIMCTKPIGAKSAEGMYSWTRQILQDRITLTLRKARADAMTQTVRDAARTG
jgi:hypothetical protein